MADVKWIKITTDIFDDEKILLIESLPDAYAIIVCWFKLLCLAGKMNNSGVFLLNDKIAYTEKMLATIFRMKESTVTLALQTFEEFGMIEVLDGVITIPNWGKHQSIEKLEKQREYQREYKRMQRAKQKRLLGTGNDNDVNMDVNVDINMDVNKEYSLQNKNKKENKKENKNKNDDDDKAQAQQTVENSITMGQYRNVFMTQEEYNELSERYEDAESKIQWLSEVYPLSRTTLIFRGVRHPLL